jgi:hypothetical protein
MALLGDTLWLWLLIIAVEGGYRLLGKEADITGVGALVAGGLVVVGAILNFDIVLLLANGVLFVVWGAVIPEDDEGVEQDPAPATTPPAGTTGGTTTGTTTDTTTGVPDDLPGADVDSGGSGTGTTSSGGGDGSGDTRVFGEEGDDGATRVYDPEDG